LVSARDPARVGPGGIEQEPGPDPARGDDDVGALDLVEGAIGAQSEHPLIGPDDSGRGRAEDDLGAGHALKHLVRADRIEGGERRIDRDRDLHWDLLWGWCWGRSSGQGRAKAASILARARP